MKIPARRTAVAALGGGSLLILGIREGLLLRDAQDSTARSRARQLGITRVAAALVLLARPRVLTRALGLPHSDATRVLPRLLAVRELAFGVGTATSARTTAAPWPWLMTIAAVDGAEAVALGFALHRRAVDPTGGWAFVAADLGSASAIALGGTRQLGPDVTRGRRSPALSSPDPRGGRQVWS